MDQIHDQKAEDMTAPENVAHSLFTHDHRASSGHDKAHGGWWLFKQRIQLRAGLDTLGIERNVQGSE